MIENEIPEIADSLWTATSHPGPACPPLAGEVSADVCIVGGGLTGVSAALHMAERGLEVRLLEAETPGWGASGRNGGQVNPGLKEGPEGVVARFGPEMGARMLKLASDAPALVGDLVLRHRIDCDLVQAGWIQAAHTPAAMRAIDMRIAQWKDKGVALVRLGRSEVEAKLGGGDYVGGLLDPRGATVHPLNYALGLARAAQDLGAVLHAKSRAVEMRRVRDRIVVKTRHGEVKARQVVLATNGYTGALVPGLEREVVPVRSVQVATQPLSDNLRATILPGGQAVSDSRRLLLYYRMDAAGRFIMGGRGAYGARGTRSALCELRKVSARLFPQLSGVDWQHAWGGNVAMTVDHYPHLVRVSPGIVAALGYNGRGVAMATAMGRVLADWATAEGAIDFPMHPRRPIPLHAARRPAVTARIAWARVLDKLGM